jgi:DNA-binding response OmpR family regulator
MPTILVVDDEQDIVELVAFNLREHGFAVITATDGSDALNKARATLPDLILLDLMLPELDGVAVCEILHRLPSTAAIPVIMLTAWASEQARVVGLEAGAEDYVTKPFSPRELLLRVKNVLNRREGQQALAALENAGGEM